ncbi:MAG: Dam family site-specific DNA-(adenine-N6)-methyltransferase [Candidatus Omnitrophica bacterium]|nr:Dam family site-specific DNA-(adenine-N6)-methyltransferase [Candidatus Omnitrophota bacterium]
MKIKARPFLKWAGGKTQLIPELISRFPKTIIKSKKINRYIEPFVGAGALFFYVRNNFSVKRSFLFDSNKELILAYKTIQKTPYKVITELEKLEREYLKKHEAGRAKKYYEMRASYNIQRDTVNYEKYSYRWVKRTAWMIFLNRTCFNGLFRLNSKGGFNVPQGRYKNPTICDRDNINAVSKALRDTEIFCDDFTACKKYATKGSLVYFDPPYRPLNGTSSFTAYTEDGFTDDDQKRLALLYRDLSKRKKVHLILSNSDPKNIIPTDTFFDDLYKKFTIERATAIRIINCQSTKRGAVKELIITNR